MATTNLAPPQLTAKQICLFWDRVAFREPHECWPWRGRFDRKGAYGLWAYADKSIRAPRSVATHRIAFFLLTAEWPLMVLHECDNPPCCNPLHLKAGDGLLNMRDMVQRGRSLRGERHPFAKHPEKRARGDRHGRSRTTEAEVLKIRALFDQGVSLIDLRKQFMMPKSTISYIALRKSWTHLPEQNPNWKFNQAAHAYHGERHKLTSLTNEEVRTIRALHAAGGIKQNSLAQRFRVCPATIANIVKRKTWDWLP